MSDVLAGVASELERNLTIDKLSHELETRPTEHRLEEMNVIKGRRNSNLSNALVGTAVALEVSRTKVLWLGCELTIDPTETNHP